MAKFKLNALFTGVDSLSPALAKMQNNLQKFKEQTSEVGNGGLATGLTASLKAFSEQEDATIGLKVAMLQSNGEVDSSFENLNKLAVGLGNKLPGTSADFQNMMQMLVQQGVPAQSILDGVGKSTAYLAVQFKKTPAAAAEFAAKMQNATGAASKDMMGLFDTVQKASYLGVDDSDMLGFFTKTSAAMKMVNQDGLTAAKSLAPIGVMMDHMGMQGESAGNALQNVMQAGLNNKKVGVANKTLSQQKTGIQLDFTNGKGEFGGIDNMFAQLSKLQTLSNENRKGILGTIFGDDADTLAVANTLIDTGKQGYDQIQQKMDKQASLNKRVEMQLGTLSNLWDSLTGTATSGLAAIGSVFSGDTKSLVTWLGDLSGRFISFAEQNPVVIRSIAGVVGGLALLGMGFKGVNSAVSLAGQVMSMSPIGMIATAIAVAAGLIIANWDTIGPYFKALWDTVGPYFEQGWELLKTVFGWTPLGLVVENWAPIVQWFRDMWNDLKPILSWFTDGTDDIKAPSWNPYGTPPPSRGYNPYALPSPESGGDLSGSPSLNPTANASSGQGIIQHNDWTIAPQARSQPSATVTVGFQNAPAGLRVMDTQSTGIDVSHDVGYSPYRIGNLY